MGTRICPYFYILCLSPSCAVQMQERNVFPFEVIKKWLPSNARSRNPAPGNDCLDLQVGCWRHGAVALIHEEIFGSPHLIHLRTGSSPHDLNPPTTLPPGSGTCAVTLITIPAILHPLIPSLPSHTQIATDRGPRDLRMRCVGGVSAVRAIMDDLTLTVQV